MSKCIIIHKCANYKGNLTPEDLGFIGTIKSRLCNPYDHEVEATTNFNLEVTCKSCRRIMEARNKKARNKKGE